MKLENSWNFTDKGKAEYSDKPELYLHIQFTHRSK